MVAAARAVGVEVGRSHAALLKVARRRRIGRDGARRRDVVGRDEVPEARQRVSAFHGCGRRQLAGHAVEVRRAPHVGGRLVPSERVGGLAAQLLPRRIAVVQAARAVCVQRFVHARRHERVDLRIGRPDVGQMHRRAVCARAERVVQQIHVHRARQRVGDHERGRGQVVLRHVRRDAPFEVAIARQHAGQLDLVCHVMQRIHHGPRVADAAHAPETARVKAQGAQTLHEPRPLQQKLGGLAARREDGLHPRLGGKSRFGGFLRHEAARQHHARIGGRRAARHRRDSDRTMADLARFAANLHRHALAPVKPALGAHRKEAIAHARKRNAVVRARRAGK